MKNVRVIASEISEFVAIIDKLYFIFLILEFEFSFVHKPICYFDWFCSVTGIDIVRVDCCFFFVQVVLLQLGIAFFCLVELVPDVYMVFWQRNLVILSY